MNHKTWIRMKSGMGILLPFGLLLLFIAGCAPSQKEMMAKDQMNRAKTAYAAAQANPNVTAYAPMELQEAGKAVQQAEKAKEPDDILQMGYIAERKSQFAVTVADGKVAERNIDKLNVEKAGMVAKKQTLEAERARQEAAKAMGQAEQARQEAGKAMSEAERAKQEAGKAMGEAEQARMAAAAEAEKAAKAKLQADQAKSAAEMEAAKAAKAKAESDQLMKELASLKAQQTERGIVLTIGDVLFATGKADLSEKANKSVATLAEFLKKNANRNVLIEGHTDSVGKDEYNLALSQKRADSVKEKLVADGIEAGRITPVGYGKKFPVASNDTKDGKAQNRRVEVVVLNEGVKAESQMRQ